MKVVIRTDASLAMGTGHVMRCLTLAGALRERNADITFICREHEGHLCDLLENHGFSVRRLPLGTSESHGENALAHARWLGATVPEDAEQTAAILKAFSTDIDWLIVDHYALDKRWEDPMRAMVKHIMVIDDLADRKHDCDLLLDQNIVAHMSTRYLGKVPPECELLLGPDYALLQPIYADMRDRVAPRTPPVRNLFIFFGGADRDNLTGRAISGFLKLDRPDIEVNVVITTGSPHAEAVRLLIAGHDNIHLHSGLPTLAQLMADADLAVGAGGATTWERMCLGLPTLVLTLADNQVPVAECLDKNGLTHWLGRKEQVDENAIANALARTLQEKSLTDWSSRCRQICDGRGATRVVHSMTQTDAKSAAPKNQ